MQVKKDVAEAVTDKVQELAAQFHKIFEPEWNARVDVLKTIVSLSSASIVLSVTFSSSLRPLKVDLFWRYAVVFSFVLFVASLILAFIALRAGTRLYEVQSTLFNKRGEINKALMEASSVEAFNETFAEVINRSFKPIERNDRLANRLFKVSSICFCSAIISLAAVGIVQLLS
jgi:ABC-type multidrug transport system fused ATPase/permease subunit